MKPTPLLFVSKHLYNFSYPKIWHTLSTILKERTHRMMNRPIPCVGLQKLVAYSKVVGLENMQGFQHVKEIILRDIEDFEDTGAWISGGMLEFVTGLVESGEMRLLRFRLHRVDCSKGNWNEKPIISNFLTAIKHHSKATISPQTTNAPSTPLYFPLQLFELQQITHFEINYYYPCDHQKDQAIIIANTTTLISIFQQTPYLKDLTLCLQYTLDENPDLEHLSQSTISTLNCLQTLQILKVLFHSEFFLTPPPSTKDLLVTQAGSTTWWQKLSENLKSLSIITPYSLNTTEIKAFNMERLQLKTLKSFYMDSKQGPKDFFDLLYSNNPESEEDPRKARD
ncbi:hypothetical protein TWF506_008745 [Arthrobotrys conoides]|uniref:Uncharacterized protein n=1 Tax=Arthrobotrys conoides TaxID=74498 RepID=A0AAN8NQA6_9PEZI